MANPTVVITRRAAQRLAAGHVWVYRSDITSLPEGILPGALVSVEDGRGLAFGTAMYSSSSQIALRLFAPTELSLEHFLAEIRERVRLAAAMRLRHMSDVNDAARLVFSEADRLPGMIIDRYADLVLVQLNTQALYSGDVREAVTCALLEAFGDKHRPRAIVERPDARIRELEQLPAPPAEPLYLAAPIQRGEHAHKPHREEAADPAHAPEVDLQTTFQLNGIRFRYNANAGQKTGAFLDQKKNYLAAEQRAALAPMVNGARTALDICTYQGGFALHLARACDAVTGVDSSRAALEIADQNAADNRDQLRAKDIEWLEADAFELLRDFAAQSKQYSIIVLDPPAFAKSSRAAAGAMRGYKELNLRALQMLPPGGILVTCSCSHHVPLAEFTEMVAAAAGDAGRRVTLLDSRGAAPDHPVILNIPETSYLKCLICQVD